MTELSVCIGSACHLRGAQNVVQTFQHMIEEYSLNDKIDFKATFCMRMCGQKGVSVTLNGEKFNIPSTSAREFFREKVLPAAELNG